MQLARDLIALVGRIGVAAVFIAHGWQKWQGGVDATSSGFEEAGIPLPYLAALFVIAVELLGSVAFIIGFALPLVAVGYAITGVGAILFVHLENGLTGDGGYELILTLTLAALAVGFNGGRFSLDHVLFGRKREDERIAQHA